MSFFVGFVRNNLASRGDANIISRWARSKRILEMRLGVVHCRFTMSNRKTIFYPSIYVWITYQVVQLLSISIHSPLPLLPLSAKIADKKSEKQQCYNTYEILYKHIHLLDSFEQTLYPFSNKNNFEFCHLITFGKQSILNTVKSIKLLIHKYSQTTS